MPQTLHKIFLEDSRAMRGVEDESVHLILTSPPYWNIKTYPDNPNQLGNIPDYGIFLRELGKVIGECFRVLVPGGRVCMVVGDVCLARRHGRHRLIPLHSDVIQLCVRTGFDYLAPIILYKIANVHTEVKRRTYALGRPRGPNSIIKNDVEYLLIFRRPGKYRKVSKSIARLSELPKNEFAEYFRQVWQVNNARTKTHPAPFSLGLAERVIKMFSYVKDVVLDPFLGTGTTMLAAIRTGRNSIGCEIEPRYIELAKNRIERTLAKDALNYRLLKKQVEKIVFKVEI